MVTFVAQESVHDLPLVFVIIHNSLREPLSGIDVPLNCLCLPGKHYSLVLSARLTLALQHQGLIDISDQLMYGQGCFPLSHTPFIQ